MARSASGFCKSGGTLARERGCHSAIFIPGTTARAPRWIDRGAVQMAVPRLRRHAPELGKAEIAPTRANPAGVEDELHHLLALLVYTDRSAYPRPSIAARILSK
jgi:hypothetical protein